MFLAYLVGINYIGDPLLKLKGSWNDVIGLQSVIMTTKNISSLDNVEIAIDNNSSLDTTSKEQIVKRLIEYAERSQTESVDEFICTFSGRVNNNGFVTSDYNTITECEFKEIFRKFSPKTKIRCVFDVDSPLSFFRLPHQYPGTNKLHEEWQQDIIILTSYRKEDDKSCFLSRFGGELMMSLLLSLSSSFNGDYHDCKVIYLHDNLYDNLISINSYKKPLFYSTRSIDFSSKLFNLK